jgi:hypothetical protein
MFQFLFKAAGLIEELYNSNADIKVWMVGQWEDTTNELSIIETTFVLIFHHSDNVEEEEEEVNFVEI